MDIEHQLMKIEHRRAQVREAQKRHYRKHTELCLERNRVIRKRYADERRCTMCGSPLIDSEIKTCVNCSWSQKERFAHATNSKRLAKEF